MPMFFICSSMADITIRATSDFAKGYSSAGIRCTRCGHKVVVPAEKIAEMFAVPMQLAAARYRLRCKACGGRMPEIEVLKPPPRS
jgi:DNA-directed RNA polymerase subunit RPC12/RpoP